MVKVAPESIMIALRVIAERTMWTTLLKLELYF